MGPGEGLRRRTDAERAGDVGEEPDPYRAMLALERWVAENLEFDLGVVMAPSSEVPEERRGTCTEYAVLLTTLARARGISARFVMGWVYVGGIFGGHAWTQARIGDEWIVFDGAVPADGPVDAARVAFLWSALDEGIGALSLGAAGQLYGQVEIAVVEAEGDGFHGVWPADAPAFAVEGDRYRAPSLGLEMVRSAARPPMGGSGSVREDLGRLGSYACGALGNKPCISSHLRPLATTLGEKRRL